MRFRFNGIDLPAMPKRNNSALPFATLFYTADWEFAGAWAAYLFFTSNKGYCNADGRFEYPAGTESVRHYITNSTDVMGAVTQYPFGLNEWGEAVSGEISTFELHPLWASYDVAHADGGVGFPATEPEATDGTVVRNLAMELQHSGVMHRVHVMQGDENCRLLRITLLSGGKAYSPGDGTAVLVGYRRADKHGGLYDAMRDGSAAGIISGNVVLVQLAPEVTAVAGVVELTVRLVHENNCAAISTFGIELAVSADPAVDVAEASGDYINWFGGGEAPAAVSVAAVKSDSTVTVTAAYADGSEAVSVIELDAQGFPVSVTKDGVTTILSWEGFDE